MNFSPFPRQGGESEQSPNSNWDEHQGRDRFRDLIDSDAIAFYICDASGVIIYHNDLAADLWGRRPAIGDTDERFCGSHVKYLVDGHFLPHDESPMADVLAGKVSGFYDAEVHIERPDGSCVIVTVNIAPLIQADGVIVGVASSFCENPLRNCPNKRA